MANSPSEADDVDAHTPTPCSELDRLLLVCLDHGQESRVAAVERVCGEHPQLAATIRSRLAFLERVGLMETEPPGEAMPEEFGDFRLLACLGRGGMGVVYLAEQKSLGRQVALKLIRADYLHFPGSRERFRREALAASRLDHPNLCPVYEAGETSGVPYIAMRFVEGETLAQRIDTSKASGASFASVGTGSPPSVLTLITLVEQLARAVHAAHEAGLVHRDIKPGNIMITGAGEPVLLDFGLVRDSAELAGLTQRSELIGTPAYMPPEQVANAAHVDRRSDIYSLALVLRECLTLERPFVGGPGPELYRQILHGEFADSAVLRRRAPRDLQIVLAKAADSDPERRYATALELADDLRRVRMHEPIQARPAGPVLRLRRWTQRHPALAAFLALLLTSLGVTSVLLARAEVSRRHAESLALAGLAAQVRNSDPLRALRLARDAVELEPNAETISELHATFAVAREVRRWLHLGHAWGARFLPRGDRVLSYSDDGTARIWDSSGDTAPIVLPHLLPSTPEYPRGRRASVLSAVFPEAGHPILTVGTMSRPKLWSVDFAFIQAFDRPGTEQNWWVAAAISKDGRSYLLGDQAGRVVYYPDGAQREPIELGPGSGSMRTLVFSDDGAWFAAADNYDGLPIRRTDPRALAQDFRAWVWDRQGGLRCELRGHSDSISSVQLRRERILTSSRDGTCRLWDLQGQQLGPVLQHAGVVAGARISPDGTRILSWSEDRTACIWTLAGRLLRSLPHPSEVRHAQYSPDGTRIATACRDGIVRLFDHEGRSLMELAGHKTVVNTVDFSPDGSKLVTASRDRTVRVFLLERPDVPQFHGHERGILCIARTRDGTELLTASEDRTVRRWNLQSGQQVGRSIPLPDKPSHIDISPDGEELLVAFPRGQRVLRFGSEGQELGAYVHDPDGFSFSVARYSGGGRMLVTGYRLGERGAVDVVELENTRRLSAHMVTPNVQLADLRIALGDVQRYAVAGQSFSAWVVDLQTHRVVSQCLGHHRDLVLGLAFTPDGRVLTASLDGSAALWDVSRNPAHLLVAYEGHTAAVTSVCVSPDAELVATTSRDGTARLWRTDGSHVATLRGHEGVVWCAVFSADGRRLYTAGEDAMVRTWIVDTDELLDLVDRSPFLTR